MKFKSVLHKWYSNNKEDAYVYSNALIRFARNHRIYSTEFIIRRNNNE